MFPSLLPLWRFSNKPPKLVTGAPTALSHVASRTPFRTQRFSPGRGLCSLGSSGLLGPPSNQCCFQVSLLKSSPHILCGKYSWLPTNTPGISGSLTLADWLSPSVKGAVPSGLSHRLVTTNLFRLKHVATYFFSVIRLPGYPNRLTHFRNLP
jgi:hypothetical protein